MSLTDVLYSYRNNINIVVPTIRRYSDHTRLSNIGNKIDWFQISVNYRLDLPEMHESIRMKDISHISKAKFTKRFTNNWWEYLTTNAINIILHPHCSLNAWKDFMFNRSYAVPTVIKIWSHISLKNLVPFIYCVIREKGYENKSIFWWKMNGLSRFSSVIRHMFIFIRPTIVMRNKKNSTTVPILSEYMSVFFVQKGRKIDMQVDKEKREKLLQRASRQAYKPKVTKFNEVCIHF